MTILTYAVLTWWAVSGTVVLLAVLADLCVGVPRRVRANLTRFDGDVA